MEMVMEINRKEVQFTIKYDGWGDYTDFTTGEPIKAFLSLKCIIDDEEVLEAYTRYDQDSEAIYTLVKIGDEVATFKGDRLDHVDVYISSRLIGNPVKSQLSIETLNWCLDIG